MLTCIWICPWFNFLILYLSETSKKRTSCSIMRLVFQLNLLSAVFSESVDVLHLVWNPLSTAPIFICSDTFSSVCLFVFLCWKYLLLFLLNMLSFLPYFLLVQWVFYLCLFCFSSSVSTVCNQWDRQTRGYWKERIRPWSVQVLIVGM